MNSIVLYLLVGAAAGLALAVTDRLVAPLVRGWRARRHATGSDAPAAAPGTLTARLVDDLVALALIGAIVLAFRLAGFV